MVASRLPNTTTLFVRILPLRGRRLTAFSFHGRRRVKACVAAFRSGQWAGEVVDMGGIRNTKWPNQFS